METSIPSKGITEDRAEMDCPGHHGAGSHPLLFQFSPVRFPNGSVWWGGWGRPCFCSAWWRDSPIPTAEKRYFAKVYIISTFMSALLFLMAYGGVLVRPDGFYPLNGIMTTFVILMVIWQGIDWLGEKKILLGLAAIILPLAWPLIASGLSVRFPALAGPVGFLCYSFVPMWGITGDSSWPVL